MPPTVFWPSALGLIGLFVGLWTYRHEILPSASRDGTRIRALGPVFIAAALAAFSGEHFTAAADLAQLVPKWFPFRLATTYVVGVALLSAALSFAARKAIRWSAPLLALMFSLFVLLLYVPSVVKHPGVRMAWVFPFREGSFALGAFCIFVYESRPSWSLTFGRIVSLWTAGVVVYFGTQNLLFPQFSPGVPDQRRTSAWVPAPHVLAYAVGAVLVGLGLAALFKRTAVHAITGVGILMTALTVILFGPDLFLTHGAQDQVTAINFVADTLLFGGTMFVIARAVEQAE